MELIEFFIEEDKEGNSIFDVYGSYFEKLKLGQRIIDSLPEIEKFLSEIESIIQSHIRFPQLEEE
ncbi:MAG: hypothetical protein AAFV80_12650 [Bacteroidota bacterium]